MRWLAALVGCLWTCVAAAQDLPALFDVRGVADGDVLNIRAGPGVAHPVVGSLLPQSRSVEAISSSADGRWLRINTGEGTGWAAAYYLQRTGPIWSFGLPVPLHCFGTEPFWSLERDAGRALFNDAGLGQTSYSETWSGLASGRGPDRFGAVWEGAGGRITATFARETCSDGMSDRAYGMSTLVLRETAEGQRLVSGCCSLSR